MRLPAFTSATHGAMYKAAFTWATSGAILKARPPGGPWPVRTRWPRQHRPTRWWRTAFSEGKAGFREPVSPGRGTRTCGSLTVHNVDATRPARPPCHGACLQCRREFCLRRRRDAASGSASAWISRLQCRHEAASGSASARTKRQRRSGSSPKFQQAAGSKVRWCKWIAFNREDRYWLRAQGDAQQIQGLLL